MRPIKLGAVCVTAAATLALVPAALAAHGHKAATRHASVAGCRVSLFAEPHVVTSGETVQLFGQLRCPSEPVTGQTVTLFERTAGTPPATSIGTAPTAAGRFYTTGSPPIASDP